MINETNFFLLNPSSALTMSGAQNTRNYVPMSLLKNVQTHGGIEPIITQRQHDEATTPNYHLNPPETSRDFGLQSFLTPRRKRIISLELSPPPPPQPRRMNYRDSDGTIGRKRQRTITSISIPSILSSQNRPSFQLLPRAERAYDSTPQLRPKLTHRGVPDICLPHKRRKTELKLEPIMLQPSISMCKVGTQIEQCKVGTQIEHPKINTQAFERMKRRHSFSAMSA